MADAGPLSLVFPFGAHVYREPSRPVEEILADVEVLKRLGFTMVKLQECWATDEPVEGDVRLERLEIIIARARELSMGVYVGLTMELAPAWLWRKHPDCRRVDARGLPLSDPTQYCLPSDGKPGPCFDHPGAREAGERFVTRLAEALGRFGNIIAWNTFQEVGLWEEAPLGFCYCPHTLVAFREWLQARYPTVEELNAAWRTAYGEWDEVEPPRRFAAVPSFIDWRSFMENVHLTRSLEWKTKALRAGDPGRRPVFCHVATPRLGSGAEWRWARAADFFGNSNYPAHWSFHEWDDDSPRRAEPAVAALHEIWDGIMLRTDYCRSAAGRDRALWGAEFQGGPFNTGLAVRRPPGAADIRRWILAGLAAGMNGISFWNQRAEISWAEGHGFGLLDTRGDSTERAEEAGRLAKAVNQHAALFREGRPPRAEVAILVSDDLCHFCAGTGDKALDHLAFGIRGHYWRFWRMGVPVDFVEREEVASGALMYYRAAILPVPLAMDAAHLAELRKFVEADGLLISDACPGRFDRLGFASPGGLAAGAEEFFGVRERELRIVREPDGRRRWTPPERGGDGWLDPVVLEGSGALEGARLRASLYLQTMEPTTAEVVLTAGGVPAGAMNRFGKGRAVLLGTFAGHGALAGRIEGQERVFDKLLDGADVRRDRVGRLLRRRRVLDERQAWFLVNPHAEEVVERVPLEGAELVADLAGDAVAARGDDEVAVKLPPASLACLVVEF